MEVNLNETFYLDTQKIVCVQAVSSGVSIGQCNWVLNYNGEELIKKIGLVTNICLDGEYRYPLGIDLKSLQDMDLLITNSNILVHQTALSNSQIQN